MFDDKESTTFDKLDILTDLCRAIATQWIGITVYTTDFRDARFYKALANYVADFMMDSVDPSFRVHDRALAKSILWTRSDRNINSTEAISFYLFDTWDDKLQFIDDEYIIDQSVTIVAIIHEIYNFENIGQFMGRLIGHRFVIKIYFICIIVIL